MKIVVISADYPSPDYIYGDVFVHTRSKEYLKQAEVVVIGYNSGLLQERKFVYEGIPVCILNDLEKFYKEIQLAKPHIIVGHLIQYSYIDFLIGLHKPLVIFIHGYEATSWKRRLMNFNSLGAFRYLITYFKSNYKQLRKLKSLASAANQGSLIQFVFVSKWIKRATEEDIGCVIKNTHIIPNGIDTNLFPYRVKNPDFRKKIVLIRSFKARNYANDIAIEAILILSKRGFFSDLEITIYGEGYLFEPLTNRIKHFSNVKLNNFFVENKFIPEIHAHNGIFLCPSRLDTQGVSMCEAMSSGLVPITSPIGGIPEYATDVESSFQVMTPQEVADKIEFLYHNPDVFVEMSKKASEEIANKCSLQNTVKKEMDVFRQTIDGTNGVQSQYQQCSKCILDTFDDPEIAFNASGVCSYCTNYEKVEAKFVRKGFVGDIELKKTIDLIKHVGEGKLYDCIIGISGGVDSTYLALKAKEFGLRALLVHFDNGWNSELAVNNIEGIVNKLGFDLHTFVIDWEEFRDLQLAFLKSSVVDIELITDHAIITKLYQLALQYKIKFILSGSNVVTESVLPKSWTHDKRDHIHIKAISKLFGKVQLKTFPLFTSLLKWRVEWSGIQSISLLDLMPYNKNEIKERISKELGWRDYGGKHYESIFTRFYQGYILPKKFGVDKRKAHLSNLICSGQINRSEALQEMEIPAYPAELFRQDYQFVLKKLGLTENEFTTIMQAPIVKHSNYPVDADVYKRFPVLKILRPVWLLIKLVKRII